ncbi:MAG TPA: diacylglycerol kinase family protein [Solirubrobacterales bacterium]|nr:diacylglycerol kinase family protein [Solirubrobacterales bacterium]
MVEGLPLALLVNPSAAHGRALKVLSRVEADLDARRIPFRVVQTRGLEDGAERALIAADGGELPVVLSGDGLVGAVGGALAGSQTPLGIVPAGRGNDLARVLGIPVDPAGAVEVLAAGHTTRIDVGEANGRRFLGIASVGLDSEANRLANETRLLRGNLVYAYAGIRSLIAWKSARFTIQAGGERVRMTGFSVAAANNTTFGGGMRLAPDADLRDGQFDVVTIGDVGKLRYATNLHKVFSGRHVEMDGVDVFRTARLELSASRPFAVYADGEHLTDLPATLRVLPRALNVVVPRPQG